MKLKRIFPKGIEVRVQPTEEQKAAFDSVKPFLRNDVQIQNIMDVQREEIFDECLIEIQVESNPWHVSQRVIDKGVQEGWMSLGKGKLTLHTTKGDVVYNIDSRPGRDEQSGEVRNYFVCSLVTNNAEAEA